MSYNSFIFETKALISNFHSHALINIVSLLMNISIQPHQIQNNQFKRAISLLQTFQISKSAFPRQRAEHPSYTSQIFRKYLNCQIPTPDGANTRENFSLSDIWKFGGVEFRTQSISGSLLINCAKQYLVCPHGQAFEFKQAVLTFSAPFLLFSILGTNTAHRIPSIIFPTFLYLSENFTLPLRSAYSVGCQ